MHITFPKANLQKAINVLQKVSQNKTSSNLPVCNIQCLLS